MLIRLVLVRLLWAVPILLGVSLVAFVLMRALPGDFAQAAAGTTAISAEALDTLRRNLGLDQPVWAQYLQWLSAALRGDLGQSFATKAPVLNELLPRLMVTAELSLIAGAMAMCLGVGGGRVREGRQRREECGQKRGERQTDERAKGGDRAGHRKKHMASSDRTSMRLEARDDPRQP